MKKMDDLDEMVLVAVQDRIYDLRENPIQGSFDINHLKDINLIFFKICLILGLTIRQENLEKTILDLGTGQKIDSWRVEENKMEKDKIIISEDDKELAKYYFEEDAISYEDTDEAFEAEHGESLLDENGVIKDKFAAGYNGIDKSPEAISKRKEAVNYARASVELEGFYFDEDDKWDKRHLDIQELWVNGEITTDECGRLIRANVREEMEGQKKKEM